MHSHGFQFAAPDGFKPTDDNAPAEDGIYETLIIIGPQYRETRLENRIYLRGKWSAGDWTKVLAFGKKVREI